jgi:hypothetical protein
MWHVIFVVNWEEYMSWLDTGGPLGNYIYIGRCFRMKIELVEKRLVGNDYYSFVILMIIARRVLGEWQGAMKKY